MRDVEHETMLIAEINEAFRALFNSSMKRVETEHITAYKMGAQDVIRLDVSTKAFE